MFLASDKTKIIERGTNEFEKLLDVGDDEHLSIIEDAIARASRDEIQAEIPRAVDRMTHHAGTYGDDRKFRAFANRLLQISEYKEFNDGVLESVIPLVKERLESHPHRSDYWAKMLQEGTANMWQETIDRVLRTDPSVYNWQRFYLWKLLTTSSELPGPLKALARSTINNPISELEAYQAIVCLGKHGDAQDRENLFVEFFSPQRSYPIQRAILIAIQELHQDLRDKFYERALTINPEHKQLVEYLKGRESPKYGVRLRPTRFLPPQPRAVNVAFMRGLGKVGGKVVRYRLARADYDYD